jgi:hypothetical protein
LPSRSFHFKCGLWPATDHEKAVPLVDLREMAGNPALEATSSGHGGLDDIHLVVAQEGIAACPGWKNGVSDLMALVAKHANAVEEWDVQGGRTRRSG